MMKGLKIFTIIAMIVLLVVGWGTFAVDTGTKIVSNNSYLSTADQYVEEGLYQRAILQYKEALAVDDKESTWTKMFAAYDLRFKESSGILSDYITDLEAAIKLYPKNTGYILKLYELHMVSDDIENAYKCLTQAIENGAKNDDIVKHHEELKYSYELDYNTFSDFKSVSASSYAVADGDKWGYIDTAGDELADFSYPFVSSLNSENIRIIETKLGSRLLNNDGIVLGIFKFTVSDAGVYADGLIPAANAGVYGYYDSFAKEKFGGYEYAGTFQNGIAAVKKDGKWFLIDTSGKKISEEFFEILVDSNGRYLKGDVMVAAKEQGEYQMFDSEGNLLDKFSATKMDIAGSNGLIAFEKNGKWGYVNTSGKIIIEPTYENARSFSNGLAAVCKDGKWGFINSSNKIVIDYQFAGTDYFNSNGSCMVRYDSPDADDEILWQLLVLNFGV